MANKEISVFQRLSEIDVSHMTERKGQFTYLSWTHAWKSVKDNYPDAVFVKTVYTDNQNNQLPFMRDTKGNTWVGVAVSIEGITVEEVFPVLNNRNQAMQFPDSFAVNTAHQRCLTKALAYHGLGINVYAGEDLPMESSNVEVLDEYKDKAGFYYADIEDGGINTGSAAGIRGVPTVIIYKKGVEVDRKVGGVPESHMKEFLEKNI